MKAYGAGRFSVWPGQMHTMGSNGLKWLAVPILGASNYVLPCASLNASWNDTPSSYLDAPPAIG